MFGGRSNFTPVTPPVGGVISYIGPLVKKDDYYVLSGSGNYPIQAWGWMVCDGRSLKIVNYPELFNTIGYLYGGSGDSFNIPDLQGQFLRGVGTDEVSTEERKEPKTKGTNDYTGVGSIQEDALQTHVHTYQKAINLKTGGDGPPVFSKLEDAKTSSPETTERKPKVKVSEKETRATNTFVYFLLKYTSNTMAVGSV